MLSFFIIQTRNTGVFWRVCRVLTSSRARKWKSTTRLGAGTFLHQSVRSQIDQVPQNHVKICVGSTLVIWLDSQFVVVYFQWAEESAFSLQWTWFLQYKVELCIICTGTSIKQGIYRSHQPLMNIISSRNLLCRMTLRKDRRILLGWSTKFVKRTILHLNIYFTALVEILELQLLDMIPTVKVENKVFMN